MDGVYAIITNIKEKGVFMSEINSFNKFIIGNRCTREEYLEAVSYYEKTATDAEKKDFDFVKRNLGSKIFNYIIRGKEQSINPFLKSRGLTLADAPQFISFYTITCKDSTSLINYFSLKYGDIDNFYQKLINACSKTNWTESELKGIATSFAISFEVFLALLKEYFYKNNQEEEYNKLLNNLNKRPASKVSDSKKTSKYYVLYDLILNKCSYMTILEYVNKENIDLDVLKYKALPDFITNYVDKYGIEKGAKTKKYLEERINLFITWKKMYVDIVPLNTSRKGQYKETIFCVKRFIISVIHSDNNNFLKEVAPDDLLVYLQILQRYDPRLHKLLLFLIKNRNNADGLNLNNLIRLITKGVYEDGQNRPFDIIDYYILIGIPLNYLPRHIASLKESDCIVLGDFLNSNKAPILNPLEIIDFYESSPDKELTINEVELILNYLVTKNIPINIRTFNAAKSRLLNTVSKSVNEKALA